MLIAAAVVPGPPAFVSELMGAAAHELDELRAAASRAVSRVLADLLEVSPGALQAGPGPDGQRWGPDPGPRSDPGSGSGLFPMQLVVLGPGEPGEFNASGPVSFASFGRDVVVAPLVDGQPEERGLPTPIMVARHLASRDIAAHPEHEQLWAGARWVTTTGDGAQALGEQLGADGTRVGLIVVADGALCHGPKAPRAQDPRAERYDDEVCAALASGQPSRLATIDAVLGEELGATGFQVWPALAAAAASSGQPGVPEQSWVGELLWAGAPYGVGWAVASWRRACQ